MNRQLFIEWNPQIMYNHHQSGPAGEVVFIPPMRDPVNHNLDASGHAGDSSGRHRDA